jgi:hypothetical protein
LQCSLQYFPNGPPSFTVHLHIGWAHFFVSAMDSSTGLLARAEPLLLFAQIRRDDVFRPRRRHRMDLKIMATGIRRARKRPPVRVEGKIRQMRAQTVMLDADLAALYGADTRDLVRAVRRNLARFPADFMFRLNRREFEILRSQIGTSSSWGGRRHLPYAFTEHGVAMLSSVLHSPRAVVVNIEIMRAFVRFRHLAQSNAELAKKIDRLEAKYDGNFSMVFEAIKELMTPPPAPPRRRIGYLRSGS